MSMVWDERAIEGVKGVHHTTTIKWAKLVGELLPDVYNPTVMPQVCELDEIETFVGFKKIWISTPVEHFQEGILAWVLGDRAC
jgi:insertion element IS1 protein InsB